MDWNACRLCCKNRGCSYLFDNTISSSTLHKKLKYFCNNIEITESDGLPGYICIDCERDVNMCYEFVKRCEECDRQYRSYKHESCVDEKQLNHDLKLQPHAVYVKEEHCQYDIERDSSPVQFDSYQNIAEAPKLRKKKKVKKKFQCDVCHSEFKYESMLKSHIKSHNDHKDFLCSVCDKSFKNKYALNKHYQRQHKECRTKDFVCEVCAKPFYTKSDIKIHLRIHTGETPYSCKTCNKQFNQIGSLRRHEKGHTGDKPFTCETCSKQFQSKVELKTHLTVHSTDKNHACNICNKLFKYKNNVLKHMKLHNSEEKHICSSCNRAFRSQYALKRHTFKLHSDKSGLCNVCMKDVPHLESHLSKHRGERPYKCDYCPSTFSEKHALTYHTSFRHLNQDKYKCTSEGCVESFPVQTMLEYHTAKVHGTVTPFLCDSCCRGFYRRSDLARHIIGTHRERL